MMNITFPKQSHMALHNPLGAARDLILVIPIVGERNDVMQQRGHRLIHLERSPVTGLTLHGPNGVHSVKPTLDHVHSLSLFPRPNLLAIHISQM
jgi:hypothetical protein